MDTVARGENVERELTEFIARADKKRRKVEGDRPAEAPWVASERLQAERESKRLRWSWVRFYEEQAERVEANAKAIATAHRKRAQAIMDTLVEQERNGHNDKGGTSA